MSEPEPLARRLRSPPRLTDLALGALGPLLITVAVLIVLKDFAFEGLFAGVGRDSRTYFLPNYCFTGRSIASGTVPAWNPYIMGGTVHAANPQSGWMHLPAMAFFSTLRCDLAARWFTIFQPWLAGVGLYWFLRVERASRVAATVGGLTLAMMTAGSDFFQSLPFMGAVAWATIALAGLARSFNAESLRGRIAWGILAAVAWGQIAAAHLSLVMVICTLPLVLYALTRAFVDVRRSGRSVWATLGHLASLALMFLMVNLAFLLPRLAYLPRTTVNLGYETLEALRRGADDGWILKLSIPPGVYLGAAVLLVFSAWAVRRLRPLAVCFTLYGLIAYVTSGNRFVEAFGSSLEGLPRADLYLHNPMRMRIGIVLAVPILVGLGTQAWLEAGSIARRVIPVLVAVGIWLVLPIVVGVEGGELTDPIVWAIIVGGVLVASLRWRAVVVALPLLLAIQLVYNGIPRTPPLHLPWSVRTALGGPWDTPHLEARSDVTLDAEAEITPGALVRRMQQEQGRYIDLDQHGPHLRAEAIAMVWGVETVAGYDPVQLARYWRFMGSLREQPKYTLSVLINLPRPVREVLQLRWALAPLNKPPAWDAFPVATEDRTALWEVDAPPRASLIGRWRTVPGGDAALDAVTSETFGAGSELILEDEVDLEPATGAVGTAEYQPATTQSNVVEVSAERDSILLIRDVYDDNWSAEIDGDPAPVLRADYLLQAVVVPEGDHTVVFRYRDPYIGYGVAGSLLSLAALGTLALVGDRLPWIRRRRRDDPRRSTAHQAEPA